jgi:hypothetical protein
MVYDAVRDEYLPATEYEKRHGAAVEREYLHREAVQLMASNEHWGPWHPTTGAVKGG